MARKLQVIEDGDGIANNNEQHGSSGAGGDAILKCDSLRQGNAHGCKRLEHGQNGKRYAFESLRIGEDESGEESAGQDHMSRELGIEYWVAGEQEIEREDEGDGDALDTEEGPWEVELRRAEDVLVREGEGGGARDVAQAGDHGRRERKGREGGRGGGGFHLRGCRRRWGGEHDGHGDEGGGREEAMGRRGMAR